MASVLEAVHPTYRDLEEDFKKWRLTYVGGRKYKAEYLTQREGEKNFTNRFDISYVPAYAKEAVLEIARSIHQRMPDVTRSGGTSTFSQVSQGQFGGVDLKNNPMNIFVSTNVVNELCFMGLVGVYVDNVRIKGATKADVKGSDHPYLYVYKREDIRDWAYFSDDPSRLRYVILREKIDTFDPTTNLRDKEQLRYRLYFCDDNGNVTVTFFDESGAQTDQQSLEISQIPIVIAELPESLLTDVSDHQISLMILSSMDMNYATMSNVPFYIEQRGNFNEDSYTKFIKKLPRDADGNVVNPEDLTEDTRKKFMRDASQIAFGATVGRYYSKDMDAPSFIHPPSEPLRASMDKQARIVTEIRELVSVSVKNMGQRFQSQDSKRMDEKPMEAGLSYIGLTLESMENRISAIWAEYESKVATVVKYPENYQLLTEEERQKSMELDAKLTSTVPSQTFRTHMQKGIVRTKFGHVLDPLIVATMEAEIDAAKAPTSDPDELRSDVEAGLVSAELASTIRGYPTGEAAKAQAEKAIRLGIQTNLQQAAHDNPDNQTPEAIKLANEGEKGPNDLTDPQKRGKGKDNSATDPRTEQ